MREDRPGDIDAAQIARIAARQLGPSGAADALCLLYSVYAVPIQRYLFFLTHDYGYAEELNQDVFLAVWRGASTYDGRASVYGWLHAISRRRARDGRRRLHLPTVRDDCLVGVETIEPPPEQVALCRLESDAVIAAIAILRPHHREVLTLVAQGLTMRDLASILDAPIGTVKRWLFEARRALGRAI